MYVEKLNQRTRFTVQIPTLQVSFTRTLVHRDKVVHWNNSSLAEARVKLALFFILLLITENNLAFNCVVLLITLQTLFFQ